MVLWATNALLFVLGLSVVSPALGEVHKGVYKSIVDLWSWSTVNNLIMTAATVVIARFTVVLARVGRRQVEYTRILERAYLSVEPGGIVPTKRADKEMSPSLAHIDICNSGRLPAKEVKWVIKHSFSYDHTLNHFPIQEAAAEGDNVVSPGGSMRQGSGPILFASEAHPGGIRKESNWYLYVWGAVYYRDGFEQLRTTRFCHRYNCINAMQVADVKGIGFAIDAVDARHHPFGSSSD
jgi:hypothetical protein